MFSKPHQTGFYHIINSATKALSSTSPAILIPVMAKRSAREFDITPLNSLKKGERPVKPEDDDEVGDFEDEFEDEFESEDEVFEAGVDGRPDTEREAEESRGMWFTLVALCDLQSN